VIFGFLINAIGLALRGTHDDLSGLCATRRERDPSDLACRRARCFQRDPVCHGLGQAVPAWWVGKMEFNLFTIWQSASARRLQSVILVLPSSAVS
jgi:hypothetical protein